MGALLVLETRICSYTSRGDRAFCSLLSSHWQRAELRERVGLQVSSIKRLYTSCESDRENRQRQQYYKRGYLFRRDNIDIQMFQEERVDAKSDKPIHADVEALWEVEVKSVSPTRNTPETPLAKVVDAILDVQRSMRGLLDLRRKDS